MRASAAASSVNPTYYVDRHVILGQALAGLGGTAVAMAIGFALKMLLARAMSTAAFGALLAAQAFVGLVLTVTSLGMPDAIVRAIGLGANETGASRRTVYCALWISVVSTSLVAVGILAGLRLNIVGRMSSDVLWATGVLACGLPITAAGDVFGAAYRGINRLGTKIVLVDIARPGVVVAALLLLPFGTAPGSWLIASLYVAAQLLSLTALAILFATDSVWHNRVAGSRSELIRYGGPITAAAVLGGPLVNGVFPLMLSAWVGSAPVALLGIALTVQALVYLPTAIFEQAVLPTWSRMAGQPSTGALSDSYRHYTNICFAVTAGAGIVLIANDTLILRLLFGPEYIAAGPAMRIATISALFGAFVGPNEAMLRALGESRAIFNARLISAVAGTTAGAVLIGPFGLIGAVSAFALSSIAVNGMYGVWLYRISGIHPFNRHHARLTAAAVVAFGAATLSRDGGPASVWLAAHILGALVIASSRDLRFALSGLHGR